MIEKVNPSHPDKVADRIAGALVDLAYKKADNPKIAVEVLIGHNQCTIIAETSEEISKVEAEAIVARIAGKVDNLNWICVPQDKHLAGNQQGAIRCGDNGIFKGVPLTREESELSRIAHDIYDKIPYDGKYILDNEKLIICQSNASNDDVCNVDFADWSEDKIRKIIINPLGEWTGGTDVDSGATNRKLGSDMAQSVTGGGLHGKDLSKADVSVNIWCFLEAQRTRKPVEMCCAIGDEKINGIYYSAIVEQARQYIKSVGGFEKFAEWGLY